MAIGWFIAPYKRRSDPDRVFRYCAMDDFTTQILADGGAWAETEVLGNCAVVKVNASTATLSTIAGTQGFQRIPLQRLDDPLSSLTNAQRNAIRNRILAMGYTSAEINASLPNLANVTLRQVLHFVTTRRLKPRYDPGTDAIVLDGAEQPVRQVESVDAEVI